MNKGNIQMYKFTKKKQKHYEDDCENMTNFTNSVDVYNQTHIFINFYKFQLLFGFIFFFDLLIILTNLT